MPPIRRALSPEQLSDPNMSFDFPPEFLDAFHATRGLCPANPEGDSAFMWYLYVLCVNYQTTAPMPVVPTLTSVSPATAAAGGPDITLDLVGAGFREGGTVYFGQAFSPLVVISDTEGTAEFAAAGYAAPGTIPVVVKIPPFPDTAAVDFVAT